MEALRQVYYYLPENFQRAVLVRRRQAIWLQQGIVFIHVPKAAGTSVNEALYGRFMGHARAWDVQRWGSTAVARLPRFAVTRNPWERTLSAYRFVRQGGGVGGGAGRVRRANQYRAAEFSSFERFVCEWLSRQKLGNLDPVFRPQFAYLCDPAGQLIVDHVGRIEKLERTLQWVEAQLGRSLVLPKSNRSGEQVDYRSYYTPKLIETVGHIYAEDVQLFGYRFDG